MTYPGFTTIVDGIVQIMIAIVVTFDQYRDFGRIVNRGNFRRYSWIEVER